MGLVGETEHRGDLREGHVRAGQEVGGLADAQCAQEFADGLPVEAPEHRGQMDRMHAGLARQRRGVVAAVRFVVQLSHHATEPDRFWRRRPLGRTISPGPYVATGSGPSIVVFRAKRVISDGSQTMVLYDIGPNAHSEELTMVHLPRQAIVWQADVYFSPARARLRPGLSLQAASAAVAAMVGLSARIGTSRRRRREGTHYCGSRSPGTGWVSSMAVFHRGSAAPAPAGLCSG